MTVLQTFTLASWQNVFFMAAISLLSFMTWSDGVFTPSATVLAGPNEASLTFENIRNIQNVSEGVASSGSLHGYAYRKGSATPFCFGENITTEQVNYNGEYL